MLLATAYPHDRSWWDGEVIGIEVLQASTFVREALLELAHAQRLKLSPAGK